VDPFALLSIVGAAALGALGELVALVASSDPVAATSVAGRL